MNNCITSTKYRLISATDVTFLVDDVVGAALDNACRRDNGEPGFLLEFLD